VTPNFDDVDGGRFGTSVEVRTLALDYEHLRARDWAAEARLSASIEREGQLYPLAVVARDNGERVIIDGYRRVRALRHLRFDTARVLVIGKSEPEALAYAIACRGRELVRRLKTGGSCASCVRRAFRSTKSVRRWGVRRAGHHDDSASRTDCR
jgi:hypothetical protein